MSGRPYQILNTLYHLHVYLKQNGEQDGFDPAKHDVAWAQKRGVLTIMDRWLLANLDEVERIRSERPTRRAVTTTPARSSRAR